MKANGTESRDIDSGATIFNAPSDNEPWWRNGMEMLSTLLALCQGNPPVTGGFPSQRTSHTAFWCLLDVSLNKLLNQRSSSGDLSRYDRSYDVTVTSWN